MTTKNTLKWRLSELPDPEELRELVKDEILTKEEARQILFSIETEEERDKKSLDAEIKFLRELVDKLAKNKEVVVKEIQRYHDGYWRHDWYRPYYYLTTTNTTGAIGGTINASAFNNTALTGQSGLPQSINLSSLN